MVFVDGHQRINAQAATVWIILKPQETDGTWFTPEFGKINERLIQIDTDWNNSEYQ